MSTLTGYLRDKMSRLGWSQNQLASKAEISESTLSNILNTPGVRPKPETLRKLADALEVPEAELTAATGYAIEGLPGLNDRQAQLARYIQVLPWLESGVTKWMLLSEDEQLGVLDQIEFLLSRRSQKDQS